MKPNIRIFFLIVLFLFQIAGANSGPNLNITAYGPSFLGISTTFTAIVTNYKPGYNFTFIFDDGVQVEEHQTFDLNYTISRLFSNDKYEEGFYNMNVTVLYPFIWERTLVANSTRFQLQRNLIGEIVVHHDSDNSNALDVEEVAVGENVTFLVELYDPHEYLKDAIISYAWSIDWDRQQTVDNSLVYNFTDPGMKEIKAMVIASLPNNVFLSGSFENVVNAKIPVKDLNVSGNPFMHHGDTLNLNITCQGTAPFIYCYKIMRGNETSDNFNCTDVSTFTTCHMEIIKYLQHDGIYHVGIYVSNNVHEIRRVIEVMVYSVTVSPTLSTVIIPIVCSLLALVIIAGGVAYFIQHKNQLAVEVANFDFQDESDSYTDRTFFENIFDSFTCRHCVRSPLSCSGQSENDPLI